MAGPGETNVPNLVAMTGLPCSGKTKISNYLVNRLGFVRLSFDMMREQLYGVTDYPTFIQQPGWSAKEQSMFGVIQASKYQLIGGGLDVVIDSTASFRSIRDMLMDTRTQEGGVLPARKLLIYLKVEPVVIRNRSSGKGRNQDPIAMWSDYWEEPVESDYGVLTYENNRPEDLVRILEDLDKRFHRQ
ncbi:MAG: AAA family ATPase [Candidatus Woesearchaeota archaeon]